MHWDDLFNLELDVVPRAACVASEFEAWLGYRMNGRRETVTFGKYGPAGSVARLALADCASTRSGPLTCHWVFPPSGVRVRLRLKDGQMKRKRFTEEQIIADHRARSTARGAPKARKSPAAPLPASQSDPESVNQKLAQHGR
jgi:hypothetical protein